jgi:hypothetical protein
MPPRENYEMEFPKNAHTKPPKGLVGSEGAPNIFRQLLSDLDRSEGLNPNLLVYFKFRTGEKTWIKNSVRVRNTQLFF